MTANSCLAAYARVSDGTKIRVRTVDPNGGRCLIENCAKYRAVQFVHCFPKRLQNDDKLLGNIEWHWDMEYRTLNLDTRYNIFCLGATLYHIHDNPEGGPHWMLIPEDHIIEQYYEPLYEGADGWDSKRGKFPEIEIRNDFKYRFLPMPYRMRGVAIHRQNPIPTPGTPPKPEHFAIYTHPFENLPLLESHLHPKFAILEAGRKLDLLDADVLVSFLEGHLILKKVNQIYKAWTRQRPEDANKDKTYCPGPDHEVDNQERVSVTSPSCISPGHGAKRDMQEDSSRTAQRIPPSVNTRGHKYECTSEVPLCGGGNQECGSTTPSSVTSPGRGS
ncbi:hypothetical protein AX17_002808 [Amanita inopinata Kibby_2008]|nr:hypothetical protein AX17_002808 [Amanita inopinata Kibby_2008]